MRWIIPILVASAVAGAMAWARHDGHTSVLKPTLVFGDPGEHDGQFHMPREVGFAPGGAQIYVLDRSQRVQVLDRDGKFIRLWETPFCVQGNPRGLDVDPEGRVYVADTHNSQLVVYAPEGKLLRKWGKRGKRPGEFICVTDVAVNSHGDVWACEYGEYNDRVQKFSPEGKPLLAIGKSGTEPGQFSRPQGIAVDERDYVYVADAVNHRIQVLTPEGKVSHVIGGVGTAEGKLRYPYDVALDRQGRVYTAEFGNNRVSVFTREGRFITAFGAAGREPGQFNHPWGVKVAPDGEIYVADTMNYRVQRFPPLARVQGSGFSVQVGRERWPNRAANR
ncbi:MAG: hypothetical protein ACO1SX_25425 [Actinomycetota bacterium]